MPTPPHTLCGVVVSAGRMMKAVKVRTTKQTYNSFLRKHYTAYQTHHVSDPASSLRTGDVVRIAPASWRSPKDNIKHVVTSILAPWGEPIEERPPIPKIEELEEKARAKREAKMERRQERKRNGKQGKDGDEQQKSLGERHTDVVGGSGVVGGEARVVIDQELKNS
ncbi:MAG: hypothetical protein Q9174_000324 [Haloplaca sp. 1 TL-2023]